MNTITIIYTTLTNSNSWIFWVYWVSVALAMLKMIIIMRHDYKQDIINCENRYYKPELTVGRILLYIIWALLPVANTIIALYTFFAAISKVILKFFNFPLVTHKPKNNNNDD